MAFLEIVSDLAGLTGEIRSSRLALERIAEALERISPPTPIPPEPPENAREPLMTVAESPHDYVARTNRESELAHSLGVAEWNPDFQAAIDEFRGAIVESGVSDAEAEDILRKAFFEARAERSRKIEYAGFAEAFEKKA